MSPQLSPLAGKFAQSLFNEEVSCQIHEEKDYARIARYQEVFNQTALYEWGALAMGKCTYMSTPFAGVYGVVRGLFDWITGAVFSVMAKHVTQTDHTSSLKRKTCCILVERALYATFMFLFLKAAEWCVKKCFKSVQFKGIKFSDAIKMEGAFFALTVCQIALAYIDAWRNNKYSNLLALQNESKESDISLETFDGVRFNPNNNTSGEDPSNSNPSNLPPFTIPVSQDQPNTNTNNSDSDNLFGSSDDY